MDIYQIYETLNRLAPFSDSVEYSKRCGFEDNSGIVLNTESQIDNVLVTMDLNNNSLQKAIDLNCQLIVTHHPVIFRAIKRVGGNLMKALNHGIGVISMHLNLDVNEFGTDRYLAEGLGAAEQEILDVFGNAGYGRYFKVPATTLAEFKKKAEKTFNTKRIITYGDENAKIEKVASFCGAGLDEGEIYASKDADLLVSSDLRHHVIVKALDEGKNLMILTHYASENYGLKKFSEKMKETLKQNVYFYEDSTLL